MKEISNTKLLVHARANDESAKMGIFDISNNGIVHQIYAFPEVQKRKMTALACFLSIMITVFS